MSLTRLVIVMLLQCQCVARRTDTDFVSDLVAEDKDENVKPPVTNVKPPEKKAARRSSSGNQKPSASEVRKSKADHPEPASPRTICTEQFNEKPEPVNILAINDPGQDMDDEMAFLMMRYLSECKLIRVLGIVVTLAPTNERTQFARKALDMLGMQGVPVGQGRSGDSQEAMSAEGYEEEKKSRLGRFKGAYDDVNVEPAGHIMGREGGVSGATRLLHRRYKQLKKRGEKVTLVVMASCQDAADFIQNYEELFASQTERVIVQGGAAGIVLENAMENATFVKLPAGQFEAAVAEHAQRKGGYTVRENVQDSNIKFDELSAQSFISTVQRLGIPLVFVSKFAAYGAAIRKEVFESFRGHGRMGDRLANGVQSSIEGLWKVVNQKEEKPEWNKNFAKRCDREWFFKTFCKDPTNDPRDKGLTWSPFGKAPDASERTSIWPYVTHLNQYDSLAVIASVPELYRGFFTPSQLTPTGRRGSVEQVGETEEKSGVTDRAMLEDFMLTRFKAALPQ